MTRDEHFINTTISVADGPYERCSFDRVRFEGDVRLDIFKACYFEECQPSALNDFHKQNENYSVRNHG